MQSKVLGCRVPNDHWSGFGFSRSSPSHALKNRLASVLAKNNPVSVDSKTLTPCNQTEEEKIGPWIVEKKTCLKTGMEHGWCFIVKIWNLEIADLSLNATGYFDFGTRTLDQPDGAGLAEIDDLATLLSSLQLTKYIDAFREQEVCVSNLLYIVNQFRLINVVALH